MALGNGVETRGHNLLLRNSVNQDEESMDLMLDLEGEYRFDGVPK